MMIIDATTAEVQIKKNALSDHNRSPKVQMRLTNFCPWTNEANEGQETFSFYLQVATTCFLHLVDNTNAAQYLLNILFSKTLSA